MDDYRANAEDVAPDRADADVKIVCPTPATPSAIITVCILFAIALALVEAGGSAKASPFLIASRPASSTVGRRARLSSVYPEISRSPILAHI